MKIEAESEADFDHVRSLLLAAFPEDSESRLVTQLRKKAQPIISLVARVDEQLVGHILFSPVVLDSHPKLQLMGLAPMAVHPPWQRRGIGSALVKAGLAECRSRQIGAVVVLGHPNYYPKFGFRSSTDFGIRSEYDVPEEAFMVAELDEGTLLNKNGVVSYHDEFNRL